MKSRSDFWFALHQLSSEIDREGDNHDQRAKNICEVLETLPQPTQDVYLSNLNSVAELLGKVLARCWDV